MTRVTLDSKVYLSGFAFGDKPKRVLEMAIDWRLRSRSPIQSFRESVGICWGSSRSRNRARQTPSRASRNSLKEPVTKPRPARVLGGRRDCFGGQKRFSLSNESPTRARDPMRAPAGLLNAARLLRTDSAAVTRAGGRRIDVVFTVGRADDPH